VSLLCACLFVWQSVFNLCVSCRVIHQSLLHCVCSRCCWVETLCAVALRCVHACGCMHGRAAALARSRRQHAPTWVLVEAAPGPARVCMVRCGKKVEVCCGCMTALHGDGRGRGTYLVAGVSMQRPPPPAHVWCRGPACCGIVACNVLRSLPAWCACPHACLRHACVACTRACVCLRPC
jgi:hypothetical protein